MEGSETSLESFIYGDFGTFSYNTGKNTQHVFRVTKIGFKSPAEHILDSNQMSGEV